MSLLTRASVCPRQSPRALILASINRDGASFPLPPFAPLFFAFMSGVAFFMVFVARRS
jgi:hypothetical protein